MEREIVIPRLGWSMEEGIFQGWLKRPGDYIKPGEPLFSLEGEKAIQEIEAVDEGRLRVPDNGPGVGSIVQVGAVIGYLESDIAQPIVQPGPPESDQSNTSTTSSAVAIEKHKEPSAVHDVLVDQALQSTFTGRAVDRVVATPRARRAANDLGVELQGISGSGAGGRIRERDVTQHAQASSDPIAEAALPPIASRRKLIAKRLMASHLQTVPVTLTTKADATNLVSLREQFRAIDSHTALPSYQDIVIKLVATVLGKHMKLATRRDREAQIVPNTQEIHIGLAVDSIDGLVVPVVREVPKLSIMELAAETRRLIESAKSGRLIASQMQGGCFTITNLGAYGIDSFTPVINLPETAILGLGAIRAEPMLRDDGSLLVRKMITLSLTFDHCVVDGAPAAAFLQDIVKALSNPSAFLLCEVPK